MRLLLSLCILIGYCFAFEYIQMELYSSSTCEASTFITSQPVAPSGFCLPHINNQGGGIKYSCSKTVVFPGDSDCSGVHGAPSDVAMGTCQSVATVYGSTSNRFFKFTCQLNAVNLINITTTSFGNCGDVLENNPETLFFPVNGCLNVIDLRTGSALTKSEKITVTGNSWRRQTWFSSKDCQEVQPHTTANGTLGTCKNTVSEAPSQAPTGSIAYSVSVQGPDFVPGSPSSAFLNNNKFAIAMSFFIGLTTLFI